ncbi:MAG: sialate O-acetylesterase [Cyclobacteriaceae bacterium]
MVLQRETNASIWGWSEPNEKIEVTASWGKSVSIEADENGAWRGTIATPKAGGPYKLKIEGSSKLVFRNVMIGEVWFCSGQSNMETPMKSYYKEDRIVSEASSSKVRLFKTPRLCSEKENNDVKGEWTESDFENLKSFSATGYFFGRHLEKELNVPIGLIQSAWGGRRIETFTPWETQKQMQYLVDERKDREQKAKSWDQEKVNAEYKEKADIWREKVEEWKNNESKGKKPRRPGKKLHPINGGRYPSGNYNGMINPFLGYSMKGVIWYQGEANAKLKVTEEDNCPSNYDNMLERLVGSWRNRWKIGDFPFYWVQLPEFRSPVETPIQENCGWAEIRQSMLDATFKIPNTGVAVAMGLGEAKNIHPHKKKEVGDRLALLALKNDYGKKDIVWTGPLAKRCVFDGKKAIITFENSGADLAFSGQAGEGFAVTTQSGETIKAEAKIVTSNQLEISSDKEITAVYYAWAQNPAGANLQNKAGLPASPFRFLK